MRMSLIWAAARDHVGLRRIGPAPHRLWHSGELSYLSPVAALGSPVTGSTIKLTLVGGGAGCQP